MDISDAHDGQPSGGLVFKDDFFHSCDILLLRVKLKHAYGRPTTESFRYSFDTQCAKDSGPHNRACKYGHARLRGSQFLAHAVCIQPFNYS